MASYIYKRLFILFALLIVIIVSAQLIGQTIAAAATEPKTLDRDLEPVVINGANVAALVSTPVEQLFVYTYTGTGWGGQIPFQVDEVTSSGNYTTTEDGLLDVNDEIAFMAKDLGDRAPDTEPLTASLTISDAWYEIEVSDPLNPTKKGWAYVVRATSVPGPPFNGDYVTYIAGTRRITTSQYELGYASAFFGIDYLALNGSGIDILDRSKLRVQGSAPFIGSFIVTEEPSGLLSPPDTTLIKDGPIRVLLDQTADVLVAGQQKIAYKAYEHVLQGTVNVDFSGISGVGVSSVRTSLDLITPTGTISFYNANTAATGVAVDGVPDSIAGTPLSKWAQISHPDGRFIQVGDPLPAGGTAKSFYRDNISLESNDTGELGSYGDAGFLVEGSLNSAFSIQSSLFFLSPNGGVTDNVGNQYGDFFSNPLTIISRLIGSQSAYLPIITKNN